MAAFTSNAVAQTDKSSRTVTTSNGDTIVDGKKLAELSRSDRESVQKDFRDMNKKLKESQVEIGGTGIVVERNVGDKNTRSIVIDRSSNHAPGAFSWSDGDSSNVRVRINGNINLADKDFKTLRFKGDSLFATVNDSAMIKRFNFDFHSNMPTMHPPMARIEIPNAVRSGERQLRVIDGTPSIAFGSGRNNTQSFVYSNTDKNGITSRMNIRVSDTDKDDLKKITGSDKATVLNVEDLTLFPNFSTGKMTLSFNLTEKGTTEVKILDSDTNTLFADKPANFSGNYIKQLSLPKNGIYYIAVSQNGKWFVKKFVKEQP